ncbi:MAG: TlpA disulfide reductase family protein [Pseudomonadota bacterium]
MLFSAPAVAKVLADVPARRLPILAMLSAVLLAMTAVFPGPAAAADEPAAFTFALDTSDGGRVEFPAAGTGKTSIVLFWATWCPYCKALMPHLQAIKYEYGDAVQVFAISIKDDGDPAAFLDKYGYDFVSLPEGDAVAERYGVRTTPGVLVVDAEGNVTFDLRDVQVPASASPGEGAGHRLKAAHRAPYWVAQLRKALP